MEDSSLSGQREWMYPDDMDARQTYRSSPPAASRFAPETARTELGDATPRRRGRTASARFLDTAHLKENLGERSLRGGLAVLASQYAKAAIDIGARLALLRLLTPVDFGLLAMVLVFTRLAGLFADLGLSTATVQREKLTEEQVSTLFWVNVAVGCGLALLLAGISPAVSWCYGEPKLIGITWALAAGVVLTGLTVQHQAILQRQMRFTVLAWLGASAVGIGAVCAVGLALLGAGYWSLVAMHLAYTAVMAVGVWSACEWRPGWQPRFSRVRSMLAFGRNLTGFQLVDYGSRNVDKVLIGGCWGSWWLGLYTQAYELFVAPIKQIILPVSQVSIPALSRLQDDAHAFRSYYLRGLSFVLFMATPFSIWLLVCAPEFISVFLGEKWLDAVPVLRLLLISGVVQPVISTTQWLFRATGRSRELLVLGTLAALATCAGFLAGLPFGVRAMTLNYTLVTLALTLPCVHCATRGTSVTQRDVWTAFARPFGAALVSAGVGLAVKVWLGRHCPLWATLFVTTSLMVATYGAVALFGLGLKNEVIQSWRALKRK